MPTDVKAPSSLISTIALTPPVSEHSVALVPVKPKVSATQQGVLIQVSDIAEHDRKLADVLRSRLDFSDVLEGGSRLSASDAHGVLSWNEYERFEIIRAGVLARDRAQSTANTVLWGTAATLALAIGATAALTDVPGSAVALFGVLGSMVSMLVASLAADDITKQGRRAFMAVAGQLASIPRPPVTQAAPTEAA